MSVTRAIIPAAGRGTRVASVRGDLPKEMIDVGGLPMIALALIELALSGITDVAVVVSPDKPELAEFLDHPPAFPDPSRLGRLYDPARIPADALHRWPQWRLFEQPEPRGVVDALSLAESWLDGEPFALVMPDNLLPGHAPPTSDVRRVYDAYGMPVMALVEVTRSEADRMGNCGRVETQPIQRSETSAPGLPDAVRISRVSDKRKGPFEFPAGAPVIWRGVGRSIVPAAFARLEPDDATTSGELDDVPRFQALAEAGRLHGVRLGSRLFDLGQPDGVREARRRLSAP